MKIKTVLTFLSIVSIIFLSGCASAPPPTGHPSNMAWYQPGASAEQTRRDLTACQYYAMVNAGGYSVQGDTVGQTMVLGMFAQSAQQSRENQLIQSRMTALGYSLVKTNSPLLKSVPIADANVVEIERTKAESGDADAQYNLGCYYFNGQGVPKDEGDAVKWWLKAAEQNKVAAQYNLGMCYYNGDGVPQNYTEAFQWLHKAAEKNDDAAQNSLGLCYDNGYGVQKDEVEACKWYSRAAAQGNKIAERNLARAYAKRGVLEAKNGDLDGALVDFNKVIEIKPDITETYALRGFVKQIKGDSDGAMADYNNDIEMNPKDAPVYYARGLLNYDSHKFTNALADFRKACELGLDVTNRDCSHFYVWLIQEHLGEKGNATKELQTYWNSRKTGTSDYWPSTIRSFLTGQLTEPDFFKAAENTDNKTDRVQHCQAYFYAGSIRLIEGDKTTTTDYFKKCLATGCNAFDVDEIISAAAELKSLETSE